jgi:hypothetical protein
MCGMRVNHDPADPLSPHRMAAKRGLADGGRYHSRAAGSATNLNCVRVSDCVA